MVFQSPAEIAFYLFNYPVYWYGIILAIAVFCGVFCAEKLADKKYIPPNFFIDFSPLIIFVGLIGARAYYCLINYTYYSEHVCEIFDIRQGGLSIHGMILVGIILMLVLCKLKQINVFKVLDVLACSVVLAQSIGRWGNFFNSEAFGRPTNSDWGLFIPIDKRPELYISSELFHPTFLYESILNLIIFAILVFLLKRKFSDGFIFFLYLVLYSIVRIFVEYFRVDSALNLFGFPIAQIVSLILFIVGVFGIYYINKKSN